jgi:hypothetical protein
MHLLHKDVPFIWNEKVQISFDSLKKVLTMTLLTSPPKFKKNFIPYSDAYESLIVMVSI